MYIVPLIIVYYAVFKMVLDYEPIEKRVRKRDANPYNTVKSNLWKGEDEKWLYQLGKMLIEMEE
jgi:hypothetical protein